MTSIPTLDGISFWLSMTWYWIVGRTVSRRNKTASGINNWSRNFPSNWIINVAVKTVNGQSKYRNFHHYRNRTRYDRSVNDTCTSSKNMWANCPFNPNPRAQCKNPNRAPTARSALTITNCRSSWLDSGPVHSSVLNPWLHPRPIKSSTNAWNGTTTTTVCCTTMAATEKNNTDFPLLVGNTMIDVLGGS